MRNLFDAFADCFNNIDGPTDDQLKRLQDEFQFEVEMALYNIERTRRDAW